MSTGLWKPRRAVGVCAAATLALCALQAATAAPTRELGERPLTGEFEGRFTGSGRHENSIWFDVQTVATGPTSMITGLRGLVGVVPAVCTREGRPGAGAIFFHSKHPGPRWPRVFVGADGTFAVRWGHRADDRYYGSYVISVRGTFEQKTVSGRVQATGTDPSFGKCRASRTFTARLRAR